MATPTTPDLRRPPGMRSPPHVTGRLPTSLRYRSGNRYGDLGGQDLTGILDRLDRGEPDQWADLCSYALKDAHLSGLYGTRISRVVQADWIMIPNEQGNRRSAELAAEFCDGMLGSIANWTLAMRGMLHGIAVGYSASEIEWEQVGRTNRIRKIHHRHGNRFRFGPHWDLRLSDKGLRRGADGFGELLNPDLWVVHTHQEIAGYPSDGGVMRSCIWNWLFRRWAEKWWVGATEKHGSPFIYARMPPNTPDAVREQMLTDLENWSSDHVAVFEQDGEIVIDAGGRVDIKELHESFMRFEAEEISKAWLGISDAVEPGANGSQAAVSTRAGVAMDPRMVVDGDMLAATLQEQLFPAMLRMNAHKFAVPAEQIPVPAFRLKTADDEVTRDVGDAQEEHAEEARADGLPVGEAERQLVRDVYRGDIPKAAALKLLTRVHGMARHDAEDLLDLEVEPRQPSALAMALRGEL